MLGAGTDRNAVGKSVARTIQELIKKIAALNQVKDWHPVLHQKK
jgi:hypothetical protein